MSSEDAERWDARHADADDHITPRWPDALADIEFDTLVPKTGTALDVACGRGAQTVWMAQRGLDVIALDASGTAIDYLESRARDLDEQRSGQPVDHDPFAHRIDARVHDLDDGLPDDATELDVIVCQRFRDPSLYPQFVSRLRPGGLLVVTVLSQSGASDPGPFHAPPGELLAAFANDDGTVLHHAEADGQESVVVRRLDRPST